MCLLCIIYNISLKKENKKKDSKSNLWMKFGLLHTFTIKKRYIYNWVWRCIFGLKFKKKNNIFKTKDQLSRLKQQSLDTLTQGLFFKKKDRNREKKKKFQDWRVRRSSVARRASKQLWSCWGASLKSWQVVAGEPRFIFSLSIFA